MGRTISVVMNTFNEEVNIKYSLGSVYGWCDEIIVVDMHSTDATREVASNYGAKIFLYEYVGYADPAREYALSKASKDWVLILDADEIVTTALANYLENVILDDSIDGVIIPWQNYMIGKRMLGGGWSSEQDQHLRFFRRGMVHSSGMVHNFLQANAQSKIVKIPYSANIGVVHLSHLSFRQTFDKLNRYTDAEAESLINNRQYRSKIFVLIVVVWVFFHRFIILRGYKDGWLGFYLSAMMSFYKLMSAAKADQLTNVGTENDVREYYRKVAQNILHSRIGEEK